MMAQNALVAAESLASAASHIGGIPQYIEEVTELLKFATARPAATVLVCGLDGLPITREAAYARCRYAGA